jgi:hypothetical protein
MLMRSFEDNDDSARKGEEIAERKASPRYGEHPSISSHLFWKSPSS